MWDSEVGGMQTSAVKGREKAEEWGSGVEAWDEIGRRMIDHSKSGEDGRMAGEDG